MVQPSKRSLRTILFCCLAKPAARGIRTHRARISPASALTHVPASSARNAADATVAEIAGVSADVVDGPTGVPIVLIVVQTVVVIVALIVAEIAAVDASSVAAGMDMAHIAGITEDTLLRAGLS